MANLSIKDLFEAGVHYGHRKRFWNPEMSDYTYGIRNGQHIINLDKTLVLFEEAIGFVKQLVLENKVILFVGCKRSSKNFIANEAQRCGMPYVTHRWMGGTLTNYSTIHHSIRKLKDYRKKKEEGFFDQLSKKEALMSERAFQKLLNNLGGIEHMNGVPDAVFISDVGHEKTAVLEAHKLGIPVIGIVDTNNSTRFIDYLIPGNDDSMRSQSLYATTFADVVLEAAADRVLNAVHRSDAGEEVDQIPSNELKKVKIAHVKKTASDKKTATADSVKNVVAEVSETPTQVSLKDQGESPQAAAPKNQAETLKPREASDAPDHGADKAVADDGQKSDVSKNQ